MKGNLLFLTFLTTALMLTSCQKSALEELESTIARQQIVIPCPQAGLWYIAVRCLTTVTSTDVPLGQEYTGPDRRSQRCAI